MIHWIWFQDLRNSMQLALPGVFPNSPEISTLAMEGQNLPDFLSSEFLNTSVLLWTHPLRLRGSHITIYSGMFHACGSYLAKLLKLPQHHNMQLVQYLPYLTSQHPSDVGRCCYPHFTRGELKHRDAKWLAQEDWGRAGTWTLFSKILHLCPDHATILPHFYFMPTACHWCSLS